MEKTIIAAVILANAIESAGTSAGSQMKALTPGEKPQAARLPGRRAPWCDGWAERKTCVNIFLIVMG